MYFPGTSVGFHFSTMKTSTKVRKYIKCPLSRLDVFQFFFTSLVPVKNRNSFIISFKKRQRFYRKCFHDIGFVPPYPRQLKKRLTQISPIVESPLYLKQEESVISHRMAKTDLKFSSTKSNKSTRKATR
jgi:hypothetical protein